MQPRSSCVIPSNVVHGTCPVLKSTFLVNLEHEGESGRARTFITRGSKPSSNDDNGSLTDSDPDLNRDNNGCSSENELSRSTTRMNVPWDPIDEQRLLAYKKEDKSWDWIFGKFPGRTPAAVRTRWTIVQRRVK